MRFVSRGITLLQGALGLSHTEEDEDAVLEDDGLLMFNAKRDIAIEPLAAPEPIRQRSIAAGPGEAEPSGPLSAADPPAQEFAAQQPPASPGAQRDVLDRAQDERDAALALDDGGAGAGNADETDIAASERPGLTLVSAGPEEESRQGSRMTSAAPVAAPDERPPEPAEEAPAEEASTAQEEAAAGGDDVLAMFREATAVTDHADLTKELEEISMDDVLSELREVRGMLPNVPEDGAA
jgi:hypothetical protein